MITIMAAVRRTVPDVQVAEVVPDLNRFISSKVRMSAGKSKFTIGELSMTGRSLTHHTTVICRSSLSAESAI